MSTSNGARVPVGATADDCARLWSTLTTEYISNLRIEVRILQDRSAVTYISIEVVDDSLETLNGSPLVNIWASREFVNPLYLISRDQLFGLLIDAHRVIEEYFRIGTPSAPTRRAK